MEQFEVPLKIRYVKKELDTWLEVSGLNLGTVKAVKTVIDRFLKTKRVPNKPVLGMACFPVITSDGKLKFISRLIGAALEFSDKELKRILKSKRNTRK